MFVLKKTYDAKVAEAEAKFKKAKPEREAGDGLAGADVRAVAEGEVVAAVVARVVDRDDAALAAAERPIGRRLV